MIVSETFLIMRKLWELFKFIANESRIMKFWRRLAICGETGRTSMTRGIQLKPLWITSPRVKIASHQLQGQATGMIQVGSSMGLWSVFIVAPFYHNWTDDLIPADTLLIGNYGLSYDQNKAQLAIWAILAAPFLLSNDLRTIKPEIRELIQNRDVIAIDQDKLGIQGLLVNKGNGIEVWARKVLPIVNGEYSYAVAFVSRRTDGHPHAFPISLKDISLTHKFGYQVKVKIRFCKHGKEVEILFLPQDLFNPHRTVYQFLQSDSFEERVNPTGANFYKFIPIEWCVI